MVVIHKKSKFDPAAHLHKHGWQGKGTALKHGHAVRPLAVVQKKTLSGIGKDRDEAVPFWDHIFAATAASLFTPSPSSSPAPSSSSWAPAPVITDSKGNILTPAINPVVVKPKLSINATARAGRELARRGLYSRFLRGKVLHHKESDLDQEDNSGSGSGTNTPREIEEVEEITSLSASVPIAGPSKVQSTSEDSLEGKESSKRKGKGKEKEGESKEEKRIRRAEKAQRKAEKEEKKRSKSGSGISEGLDDAGELSSGKQRKKDKKGKRKAKEDVDDMEEDPLPTEAVSNKDEKKDKKRKIDSSQFGAQLGTQPDHEESPEELKKKKKDKKDKKDKQKKKDKKG